jgi:hypothetical protein
MNFITGSLRGRQAAVVMDLQNRHEWSRDEGRGSSASCNDARHVLLSTLDFRPSTPLDGFCLTPRARLRAELMDRERSPRSQRVTEAPGFRVIRALLTGDTLRPGTGRAPLNVNKSSWRGEARRFNLVRWGPPT